MRNAIVLFMSMGFIVVLLAILTSTLNTAAKVQIIPNEKLLTIQLQELLKDATTAIDFANKKKLFQKGYIPLGVAIPISLDEDNSIDLIINNYSDLISLSNKDKFIEYMSDAKIEDPYLLYDIIEGLYDYDVRQIYPYFINPLNSSNQNPKNAFILSMKYYIKISGDPIASAMLNNSEIMTMFAYKTLRNRQLCQINGLMYGYVINIEFLYNTKKKEIDEISFTYNAKNS